MKQVFVSILLIICCFASACSTSSTKASQSTIAISTERKATNEEVAQLSKVLFVNHENKGAHYIIRSGTSQNGFTADAFVSWSGQATLLHVSLYDKDKVDITAQTTSQGVFETLPQADPSTGIDPSKPVLRNFNPSKYAVDSLSQFLMKLASDAPDNPILIGQKGVISLGIKRVGQRKGMQYKLSDAMIYTIDDNGELIGVEAKIKGFINSVSFELIEFGDYYEIANTSGVEYQYSYEAIPDVYWSLRPGF